MYTFTAWIRFPGGGNTHVQFQASDWHAAQQLAELMYGAGNVINVSMVSW